MPPRQALSTPARPRRPPGSAAELVSRLGAHPQVMRYLHRADIVLIHPRGLQPHALTPARPTAVRPPPSGYLIPPAWTATGDDHAGAPYVIKQTDPLTQLL